MMDTKKASAAQKRQETKARKLSSSTAKAVAAYAFRNGPVEDMHSAGQLSQGDMKALNKFAVDRDYTPQAHSVRDGLGVFYKIFALSFL